MNVLGSKESISKSTFVDWHSEVWSKGLSETNTINEEIEEENLDDPATSSTLVENKDHANGCGICNKIGLKPLAILQKMWVISWALIDTPKEVVEESFEEVILGKIKGPMQEKS